MKCKFQEDHLRISPYSFKSRRIYCRYIPNTVFLSLCLLLWPCLRWARSVPQHGPVGRSWHSFTPVSSDHIFLFGGFTTERETLSESYVLFRQDKKRKKKFQVVLNACPVFFFFPGDAWLYCVSKNEWKPFKHNHTQRPRLVSLNPLSANSPCALDEIEPNDGLVIVPCVSDCGTQRVSGPKGKCLCLEDVPTTCCLNTEL